jgi:hypothetical protein
MLARRACSSVRGILSVPRSTATSSRTFAAGTAMQRPARAPALADITPDAAASFNKKQTEFREGLVAAQKQKEQQESTSLLGNLSTLGCLPDGGAVSLAKPWDR